MYRRILLLMLLSGSLWSLCAGEDRPARSWRMGGQLVFDYAHVDEETYSSDDTEIRRARLFLKGAIASRWRYEIEYSLRHGGAFKDLYLLYRPSGHFFVKTGNIKEPFGLEALTSSKYNTFMERALPDIFMSGRKLGIVADYFNHYRAHNLHLSAGCFNRSVNDYGSDDARLGVVARAVHAYYFEKHNLLHLGIATAYEKLHDARLKFYGRAESHLSSEKYIRSKLKHIRRTNRIGLEALYLNRRFSLQSEYVLTKAYTRDDEDYTMGGGYLQLAYFLTDDMRRYKKRDSLFGRLHPSSVVGRGGYGALESAFRVSMLGLEEKKHRKSHMYAYTAGLNWYLRDNLRVMCDYGVVIPDADFYDYHPRILQMRLQYDF